MKPLSIEKTFTDRRIDRYISDIRKYKLVTVEEEILLAQKIREW
ncbi:MAG: sigma-70 factor domain-containing protein [Candidatus Paceibacterota bacterium]